MTLTEKLVALLKQARAPIAIPNEDVRRTLEYTQARAEAAEAQVAALREAISKIDDQVARALAEPGEDTASLIEICTVIESLQDTDTAVEAFEQRIKAEAAAVERRKVLEVVNLMATCLHTSRECPQWMTPDFSYATEMFRGRLAALDAKEGINDAR